MAGWLLLVTCLSWALSGVILGALSGTTREWEPVVGPDVGAVGAAARHAPCGARKSIVAVQAAWWYSLMIPPRTRLRRIRAGLGPWTVVGWVAASGGSWLRARWGRCLL